MGQRKGMCSIRIGLEIEVRLELKSKRIERKLRDGELIFPMIGLLDLDPNELLPFSTTFNSSTRWLERVRREYVHICRGPFSTCSTRLLANSSMKLKLKRGVLFAPWPISMQIDRVTQFRNIIAIFPSFAKLAQHQAGHKSHDGMKIWREKRKRRVINCVLKQTSIIEPHWPDTEATTEPLIMQNL